MMRLACGAVAISLVCLLTACSTPVTKDPLPSDIVDFADQASQLFSELQSSLPGFYSNYTQVIEAGGSEDSVTDLTVIQLATQKEPVFIFESRLRGAIFASLDLYFAKLNPESRQPELHFSRMTGSELSMSLAETLDTGWKRVEPGCVIALAPFYRQTLTSVDGQLFGKSNTETCLFDDPLHGRISFERSLSISSNQIAMTEVELKPGEVIDQFPMARQFQKHQTYEGTISLNASVLADDIRSSGWQQSTTFNLYDDGRIRHPYDSEMKNMDYAVRLSRLHWRENQPPYLKLEIVNLISGGTQAYSWFSPESKQIDWELDWVKVHLSELSLNLE